MDFSKAIMNVHNVDIDRVEKELDIKLNDKTWREANNRYAYDRSIPIQSSDTQAYFIDYDIPNAIFIFAEIKKRFEAKGWRVMVLHHQSKTLAKLQLYK